MFPFVSRNPAELLQKFMLSPLLSSPNICKLYLLHQTFQSECRRRRRPHLTFAPIYSFSLRQRLFAPQTHKIVFPAALKSMRKHPPKNFLFAFPLARIAAASFWAKLSSKLREILLPTFNFSSLFRLYCLGKN